jgi:hypothetical protein
LKTWILIQILYSCKDVFYQDVSIVGLNVLPGMGTAGVWPGTRGGGISGSVGLGVVSPDKGSNIIKKLENLFY